MHSIDEGSGSPLLFVHGTPTWSLEWRHLVRALARTHRCIAPDLLGFGLSERLPDFPSTPEAHAEAFARLVGRLDRPPFTLVVHDYGGPIGLPVCLQQPGRVARVVLLNSGMWSFAGDNDMEWKGRIAGGGRTVPLALGQPVAAGDHPARQRRQA
jgi:haloalkane dehalogenase